MREKVATTSRSGSAVLGVMVLAFSVNCSSKPAVNSESSSAPAAAQSEAAASGPSDSEIVHILMATNTVDIQSGELVKKKSKNKKVQAFATRAIAEHTSMNKQAADLTARLGIAPKDNPASQDMRSGANNNTAFLKQQNGKAFDRAYLESEIAFHTAVLNAIDKLLVPNAKNEELKALIVKVRPEIAAHLDQAKKLHASLAK